MRDLTKALARIERIERLVANHREAAEWHRNAKRQNAYRIPAARRALGEAIVARRQALGLDAAQIARIARVNASELSKLERGTISYTGTIAYKVCDALTRIERERAERGVMDQPNQPTDGRQSA